MRLAKGRVNHITGRDYSIAIAVVSYRGSFRGVMQAVTTALRSIGLERYAGALEFDGRNHLPSLHVSSQQELSLIAERAGMLRGHARTFVNFFQRSGNITLQPSGLPRSPRLLPAPRMAPTAGSRCKGSLSIMVAVLIPPAAIPEPPGRPKLWLERQNSLGGILNQTMMNIQRFRTALPSVHILRATNGFNHTEVIEHLLHHRVPFLGLSKGGKKWGKLATFLTKCVCWQQPVVQFSLSHSTSICPPRLTGTAR